MTGGRQRRLKTGAVLLVLAPLAGLGALAAMAQEAEGPLLTFGVALRAETTENQALTVPSEGRTNEFGLGLTFALLDETRLSRLSFTGSGFLRTEESPDGTRKNGLSSPTLRFDYRRNGVDATFDASAFLRESDIDSLDGIFIDPDTGDVSTFDGSGGTVRQTGGDLAYTFGVGGPWGLTLGAGLTDTTYSDAPGEVDNLRTRASALLRFALNPATDLTAGLRYSTFEEDGQAQQDTLRAEAGIARDLAAGSFLATLFVEEIDGDNSGGFTLGATTELPAGQLAYGIGATRVTSGEVYATGSLDWAQELPRGSVSLGFDRTVGSGNDNAETLVTSLNAGVTQNLSALTAINFGLTAAVAEDTGTGDITRSASLSATLRQSLTADWAIDAGVTHRLLEEDGEDTATSNRVFLELRRDFAWRP